MSESDDPRHAWPADRGRAARLRSRVRPEGQADTQGTPSGAEPPQPGNRRGT